MMSEEESSIVKGIDKDNGDDIVKTSTRFRRSVFEEGRIKAIRRRISFSEYVNIAVMNENKR